MAEAVEAGRASSAMQGPERYESIQYLRGIAALMVVFVHSSVHYGGFFDPLGEYSFASSGVDIFFVISGFIMFTAAREEPPAEFMRRRLIRVAPLYWLATAAWFLINLAIAGGAGRDLRHVLLSLLFIPHRSAAYPDSFMPYLEVGWTLNCEMLFYCIFAAGLAIRQVVVFPVACILLLVSCRFWATPETALGYTYTSSMLVEFAVGLLIGEALEKCSLRGLSPLLLIGVLGLAAVEFLPGVPRGLSQGVPAALVVLGALSFERSGKLPRLRSMRAIGDCSYSLYLSHSFVAYALVAVWRRLPLQGWPQYLTFVPALLVSSVFVALLCHHSIEKPLTRYLSRFSIRHLRSKQVSDVA